MSTGPSTNKKTAPAPTSTTYAAEEFARAFYRWQSLGNVCCKLEQALTDPPTAVIITIHATDHSPEINLDLQHWSQKQRARAIESLLSGMTSEWRRLLLEMNERLQPLVDSVGVNRGANPKQPGSADG